MATVTRYPSANNGGWDANETNGYADDGSYATTAPGTNSTESVEYGNFGFDAQIPAGATITSVTINAQWKLDTTASSATFLCDALVNNSAVGTQHSDTSEPTSDKTTSYANDYGSWDRDKLLDGVFEVRIGAKKGSGATGYTMSLDYVSVTVVYTVAYTITAALGEFALTGKVAGLKAARKLTAALGEFSLTGNNVTLTYTPAVAGGIIIDIDHEGGNLTEYTSTDTDSGDLSAHADAALAGTGYGLKCVIDDTNNIYGTYELGEPNTSGIWRSRFYFDPNSITWANGTDCELMVLQGGAPTWGEVAIVKFGKTSGGSYKIHSQVQIDSGGYDQCPDQVITDAPHWIEIEATKGAGTGRHRLWIDTLDAPVYDSDADLDNDTKLADLVYAYFGAFGGVPEDASGTYYLDELIVNDTGDPIGPVDVTAYSITAVLGEFALTGNAAALRVARKITAAKGAFTLTGIAAALKVARRLVAAKGTFTLTGIAAGLKAGRKITAAKGAFTLTGIASGLKAGRRIAAASGGYTLTGQAAALKASRKITAALGEFTLSGKAANLKAARRLVAALGEYSLTGNDATLTYTPSGGAPYTLTAEAGTFTLTGNAAGLKVTRKITAEAAAYILTGKITGLKVSRKITAANGAFILTGNNVHLKGNRRMNAQAGSLALTGISAAIRAARKVAAGVGSFVLTGSAAILTYTEFILSVRGRVVGSDAALNNTTGADATTQKVTGSDAKAPYS